jgi:hypothetical protein
MVAVSSKTQPAFLAAIRPHRAPRNEADNSRRSTNSASIASSLGKALQIGRRAVGGRTP